MTIYVDVDHTLCEYDASWNERDYSQARPIRENINKVNALYKWGHTIVIWTGRGTGSGIDWREVTRKQLEEWGVKYHELKTGKPVYDLLLDDRALNSVWNWDEGSVGKVLGRAAQ